MSVQATFDLRGRVAIVTGGAGLLGREFSRALAESGARVAIADLDSEAAGEVADELQRKGYVTLGVGADVTRPESIAGLMNSVVEQLGPIDVLVNSAALDPKFDCKLALPPDDELLEELTSIKWELKSNGRIKIEEKE